MMTQILALMVLSAPPTTPVIAIRVDGDGYLRFARSGTVVYAREAQLTIRSGRVVSGEGLPLAPTISVPEGTTTLSVGLDGTITAGNKEVGRIVLALIDETIRPVESDGFFLLEGKVKLAEPGEGLAGVIRTSKGKTTITNPTPAPKAEEVSVVKVYPLEEKPKEEKTNQKVEETTAQRSVTDIRPDLALLRSGGIHVHLPATAEVDGDAILLGEATQIFVQAEKAPATAALDLGTAPPFGVERTFDRAFIIARLRRAGFPADKIVITGATTVRVRRQGQEVSHQQFVESAIAKAGTSFTLIEQNPQPALIVPKGKVEMIAERSAPNGQVLNVTVAVYVDGRRFNSRTIALRDTNPPLTVKVGDTVDLRVRSGSVVVMTKGRITRIDQGTRTVSVRTPFGTEITGKPAADGAIEVQA